jgi:hypothetical protein
MVPASETTRVYLNEKRQGVVTCVHCDVKRTINMSNYTDHYLGGKPLKVKCDTCNKIFHVKFDCRRYHRIHVNLPGKIFYLQTKKDIGNIIITSLSCGGIGFIINNNLDIKTDIIYVIEFQLDDEHRSVICEEIVIKRVDGCCVGAEFYHRERYNHALDFYMMRPLHAQQNASEGHQAFPEVVEDWSRNPHADEAVLDAVPRRQERQDDDHCAHIMSADNGTHATPSPTVVSAAQLVKLQGEQPCETWLLPPDRPILVGRAGKKPTSLDIDLWPDRSVSRRQALIWFDGEGWCIEDLRSANGTVLDESNIRGQRALRLTPGTTIQFGRTVLMLTALALESGESTQASPDVPSAD